MAILDYIKDAVTKAVPQKRQTLPVPGSTGVGHGVYRGEDVSKPLANQSLICSLAILSLF